MIKIKNKYSLKNPSKIILFMKTIQNKEITFMIQRILIKTNNILAIIIMRY